MSVFGPMSGGNTVENAVETYLKRWLNFYLYEVERQQDLNPGDIARPRAWEIVTAFDLAMEPQMPAIYIVSPGTSGKIGREGDGTTRATWDITVVALVTAADEKSTRELGQRYTTAIRTAIEQRRSLESEHCRGADFTGDTYTSVDVGERRTKMGAGARFMVEFTDLSNFRTGPTGDPPGDPSEPPADWPIVRSPFGDDDDPADTPYNPVTVDQK